MQWVIRNPLTPALSPSNGEREEALLSGSLMVNVLPRGLAFTLSPSDGERVG
jgi:hypothetical protein